MYKKKCSDITAGVWRKAKKASVFKEFRGCGRGFQEKIKTKLSEKRGVALKSIKEQRKM